MKFSIILPALKACSHAMFLPSTGSKDSLQKRADSDLAKSGADPAAFTRRDVVSLHYIVVLKSREAESAYKEHGEWVVGQLSALKGKRDLPDEVSGQVEFFNVSNFMGYTGYLLPALLDTIKENPLVDFVEEDQIFETTALAAQPSAPWGLTRISRRGRGGSSSSYYYDDEAGKGVTAYVLDTGSKVEHSDFEDRATWGVAIPAPHAQVDGDGHGIHIAGTLGGKTFGVAKKVDLVAVQVFDSSGKGPTSTVIKGIKFAVKAHQDKVSAKTNGYKGATMNFSLGGPASDALDLVVDAAVDAGVHVVVAVGNKNIDACNRPPAKASGPITVGAIDDGDRKADFSNYGSCVDVQAPGVCVYSAGIRSHSMHLDGTSMATPHVTGILSLFMSLQPGLGSQFSVEELIKPADLKRKFLGFATKDAVKGLDSDSPNLLAYNGEGFFDDLWNL